MTYYQLNMFDNPTAALTEYEKCLARGSGFEGGKIRIYAACRRLPDKDFPKFLKEEYGTGGCSIEGGFLDYGPSGLCISKWNSNNKQNFKWNQVAKDIKRLISLNLYLTDKEKERIRTIENNNNNSLPIPNARFRYE